MKTRILYILLVLLLLSSLCACDLQGPGTSTVKVVASFALDAVEGEGLSWGIVHAMQLALEEADYRAGDLTVELVVWNSADENGDMIPEVEEANAQKAAADPDVLVYLGSISSGGCKISLPILNRAGVAQFSPSATYPGLTKPGFGAGEPAIYYPSGKRTFFRVVATDDMQGPAGALWAQDQGLQRVYIIEQDELYGRGLARTFRQAAEAAGLTIVGTSTHTEGQTTDLDQIVAEVSAQQFDLIYYTGFRTTGVPLIQALRAAGVKAPVMGADAVQH